MTNTEIITNEAIRQGIYSKEETADYLSQYGMLPLHTYGVWKAHGFIVRRGEQAVMSARLWKYRPPKKSESNAEEADERSHYYLYTAHLFKGEQVEPMIA